MIQFRQAKQLDIVELLGFEVVKRHHDIPFRGDSMTMPEFVAEAVASGSCYVALVDGRIGGFAILDYSFFGFGYIPLLITIERFQREGIGSLLMRRAETQCRTQKLFTSTERSNEAMQTLLTRLGYMRCGIIEKLEDEGEEEDPELIYFKRVS
jgi:ribosomal protein S18 acetylase RimI-like enzyme